MSTSAPGRRDHLTFKGNLKETRYGWLRLTPAYSVHLVAEWVMGNGEWGMGDDAPPSPITLDPFCGTGTTALVCAERGVACDTTDINPFLIWLTRAKTRFYSPGEIEAFVQAAAGVAAAMAGDGERPAWVPPLHRIDKWWDAETLAALGRAMAAIREAAPSLPDAATDLLKLAFCRVMIECSRASFGHQSMSFKQYSAGDGPPSPPTLGGDDAAASSVISPPDWERALVSPPRSGARSRLPPKLRGWGPTVGNPPSPRSRKRRNHPSPPRPAPCFAMPATSRERCRTIITTW